MSMEKNYITPQGYQKLKDEREWLIKTERPKVVDVVSWAAGNGDRSENGDYIYGKRRLREIDKRIRFLNQRIDAAEVVNPLKQKGNTQIFFGATVIFLDENGKESRVQIVGVDEIESGEKAQTNKISWISPLARALLKKNAGDVVEFKTPKGFREIEIVDVFYE